MIKRKFLLCLIAGMFALFQMGCGLLDSGVSWDGGFSTLNTTFTSLPSASALSAAIPSYKTMKASGTSSVYFAAVTLNGLATGAASADYDFVIVALEDADQAVRELKVKPDTSYIFAIISATVGDDDSVSNVTIHSTSFANGTFTDGEKYGLSVAIDDDLQITVTVTSGTWAAAGAKATKSVEGEWACTMELNEDNYYATVEEGSDQALLGFKLKADTEIEDDYEGVYQEIIVTPDEHTVMIGHYNQISDGTTDYQRIFVVEEFEEEVFEADSITHCTFKISHEMLLDSITEEESFTGTVTVKFSGECDEPEALEYMKNKYNFAAKFATDDTEEEDLDGEENYDISCEYNREFPYEINELLPAIDSEISKIFEISGESCWTYSDEDELLMPNFLSILEQRNLSEDALDEYATTLTLTKAADTLDFSVAIAESTISDTFEAEAEGWYALHRENTDEVIFSGISDAFAHDTAQLTYNINVFQGVNFNYDIFIEYGFEDTPIGACYLSSGAAFWNDSGEDGDDYNPFEGDDGTWGFERDLDSEICTGYTYLYFQENDESLSLLLFTETGEELEYDLERISGDAFVGITEDIFFEINWYDYSFYLEVGGAEICSVSMYEDTISEYAGVTISLSEDLPELVDVWNSCEGDESPSLPQTGEVTFLEINFNFVDWNGSFYSTVGGEDFHNEFSWADFWGDIWQGVMESDDGNSETKINVNHFDNVIDIFAWNYDADSGCYEELWYSTSFNDDPDMVFTEYNF
ncbi:MAG: hypothetical protein ABIA04_06880 [Pseudomonadota bacterium]